MDYKKQRSILEFRLGLNAIPHFLNEHLKTEWGDPLPLPMWGTLWTHDRITSDWVEEVQKTYTEAELEEMGDDRATLYRCGWCPLGDTGVLAFVHEDGDVILGIDGAGYDFESEHWEPLYDLLGFKWHENTTRGERMAKRIMDLLKSPAVMPSAVSDELLEIAKMPE